jgi:MOSC domain-containing protein YiiM
VSRRQVEDAAQALAARSERTRRLGAELTEADAQLTVWADWTIKDVLGHVEASHRGLLRRMNGTVAPAVPGQTLADLNEQRRRERADWSLADTLARIEEGRQALLEYLAALPEAEADRPVLLTGGRELPLWRIAWTTSTHEREHLTQIEQALQREPGGGEVASLNVSNGGVPKLPIFQAELGELGLAGDAHRGRMHGGPTAALCLFGLDTIARLQGEGHPIYPGAVGENVTVSGLEWSDVRPGDRLRIGPALVEVTRYTVPCKNIAAAFAEGDFSRIHPDKRPGEARVYARVIEGGTITVGDPVIYLPA